MKIVLQKVKNAKVEINAKTVGQIDRGLLLFVGIAPNDDEAHIEYAVRKIVNMRIFPDQAGKMNLSVKDIGGQILSISQFTLFANVKKGNRPAFTDAASPQKASHLYEAFNSQLAEWLPVQTGIFGADMQVTLTNDGPVTILLDTQEML